MDNNQVKISVVYGAMCPSISQQLKKQKVLFDKNEVSHYQKDSDAISRLHIRGIMSYSEYDKARKRLNADVMAHIKKMNKIKGNVTTKK